MSTTLAEALHGPLEPPPHLSPSSIETFQICPLKYKLSRIDGLQEPPTEASVLGNYVHDVLEDLLKLPPDERDEASAKALLSHHFTAPRNDDPAWGDLADAFFDTEEDRRKFRWRAWWCVENYFKMEDPKEVDYGGLETPIYETIDGVTVKGFIDRWDHVESYGFSIVDYKTGKAPAPRYKKKKFQQLGIYSVATQQVTGLQPVSMKLMFVKDGITMEEPVTKELLTETRVMLRTTRDAIEERCASGHFEPVKNGLCAQYCSFKPICPLWT